ncbi:MAG: NAD(P)/FAD-dependent oxidoreductase, partial [Actinomycetota bacterium]|nr:NAD(P)/FAD-dependent oxidoreductase [Actinomycetota bacterium]
MSQRWDVIVVGGGHNGLVAAGYLARSGMTVLLLEQRPWVGGLTTTEEIFPGFWAEPASQVAHGIEPIVYRDMRLFDFGVEAVRPDPYMVTPFPDGRRLVGYRSAKRLVEEIRQFSEPDAAAWFDFRSLMTDIATDLRFSPLEPPPTIVEFFERAQQSKHAETIYKIVFGTIREFFDERFESEEVKSVLSLLATAFNIAGPMSFSPYMLLHWAYPQNALLDPSDGTDLQFRGGTLRTKGGIGSLTKAMGRSAEADGVEIRVSSPVSQVVVEDGVARGVVLESGERCDADFVLSTADPNGTLLHLVGPDHLDPSLYSMLQRQKPNGGGSKFIMAFDGEPRFAAALDDDENRSFLRSSFRFAPTMEYQERAYDDAKYGEPSRHPVIYGQCPTAIDPSLAPEGKNIINLTVFHAPYCLRSGTWDDWREPFSQNILATVREYITNLDEGLMQYRLITPADIEAIYRIPGGSPTHGPMSFPRLMGLYPQPSWQSHTSPITNLFFGGAGTWPGGGVTGGPGYNG